MKKTKLTFIESLLCARYSKINFKIVLLNPKNIKDEGNDLQEEQPNCSRLYRQ